MVMLLALVPGVAPSDASAGCAAERLEWTRPVEVGEGFEPSIEVDDEGTIFITGAAGIGFGRSLLWRSTDGGRSFETLNDPASGLPPGFEGDIALDGRDKLYFADTWLGDSHLYRYSARDGQLQMTRRDVPTPGLDDRPWLAAHGDGVVYYMANAMAGPGSGRQQVVRSLDGGETFGPPTYLANSGLGFIDADPNSEYVYAATNRSFSKGTLGLIDAEPEAVDIHVSADRGATWVTREVARYELPLDESRTTSGFTPIVSVSPRDGSVYLLWSDGAKRLKLARSRDRGLSWRIFDVTPFAGTYGYPWLDVARDGTAGITFVADPDGGTGRFAVYGMLWRDKRVAVGEVPGTSSPDGMAQDDFFQIAFGPDNRAHLVVTLGGSDGPTVGYSTQIGPPCSSRSSNLS